MEFFMVILGIDPGYAIVGYGFIEYKNNKYRILEFGAVTTPADMDFPQRLKVIYEDLSFLCQKHRPQVLSIEKLFFNTNKKTAVDVAQARGVILLAAAMNGVEICEYTPLQVKQSVVGYGRAEKKQVQEMTKNLLGLSDVPKPDDTADALALALCHAHASGSAYQRIGK